MKKLGVMLFLQQFAKMKHFKPVLTVLLSLVVFASCKKDFLADARGSGLTAINSVLPTDLEQSIYTTLLDFGKNQDKRSVNAKWFLTKGNTVSDVSDELAEKIRVKTVEQTRLINQLGNEGYYDYLRQSNILPISVVDYAEKMNGIIRVTLDKGQNSFSNVETAIKQIEAEVTADKSLKSSDLQLIKIVAASTKASYHFLSENASSFAVTGIQARDACSPIYWGGAGVGAGLITAYLIHTEVIAVASAIPVIGAVAFGVAAIYAIVCNWSDISAWLTGGSNRVDCVTPPSIPVDLIQCDLAELSSYGGRDIVSYDWRTSENITFEGSPVTTLNTIRGRTTNPNSPTKAIVIAKCKDGSSSQQGRVFRFIDLNNSLPPSVSIVDGPHSASLFQRTRFSTTSISRGVNVLSWEIRGASGGSINAHSSYFADITFYAPGDYIIVAKMTNTCSGQVSESRWNVSAH